VRQSEHLRRWLGVSFAQFSQRHMATSRAPGSFLLAGAGDCEVVAPGIPVPAVVLRPVMRSAFWGLSLLRLPPGRQGKVVAGRRCSAG